MSILAGYDLWFLRFHVTRSVAAHHIFVLGVLCHLQFFVLTVTVCTLKVCLNGAPAFVWLYQPPTPSTLWVVQLGPVSYAHSPVFVMCGWSYQHAGRTISLWFTDFHVCARAVICVLVGDGPRHLVVKKMNYESILVDKNVRSSRHVHVVMCTQFRIG